MSLELFLCTNGRPLPFFPAYDVSAFGVADLACSLDEAVINLKTIGRAATSETLGVCLLIRLFQDLISWMPCCVSDADAVRSVC